MQGLRHCFAALLLFPVCLLTAQTTTPARAVFQYHLVKVQSVCYESDRSWTYTFRVDERDLDLATQVPMAVTCGVSRVSIPTLQVAVADKSEGIHSGMGNFTPSTLLTSYTASVFLHASNPADPARIDPITMWSGGTQCKNWGKAVRLGTNPAPQIDCAAGTRIPMTYDFTLQRWSEFAVESYFGGYVASGGWFAEGTNRADLTVTVQTWFKSVLDGDVPPDPHAAGKATDWRFIGSNATRCTKRSGGRLKVPVRVSRVVASVDAKGELADPGRAIAEGLVYETATLRLPVFMRNFTASKYPGVVRVRINGLDVGDANARGEIVGQDEKWTVGTFSVPAMQVRYGRRVPGSLPEPGENEVTLEIDTESPQQEENWCAATDWAELRISALYPVIMVHGNGQGDDMQGGEFWDGLVLGDKDRLQMPFSFTSQFREKDMQYDSSISMPTDTIAAHGDLLATQIPARAAEFGARHAHLVAHSKGGLDCRDFLARTIPRNFGVLSLTTLSTPHQGSPGPDYQIDSVGASAPDSDDSTRTLIGQQAPPNKGTPNLRVAFLRQFNSENVPLLPRQLTVDGETLPVAYRSISADMNVDDSATVFGNPSIQHGETTGLPGQKELGVYDWVWASLVEQVYRLIGNVQSTYTEVRTIPQFDPDTRQKIGELQVKVVKEVPAPSFQLNDSAVSLASSKVGPFVELTSLKANHSTIAGPTAANHVIRSIQLIQPLKKP